MENNKAQMAHELWRRINKRTEEILDYRNFPSQNKSEKIQKLLNHTKNYFNENAGEFDDDFKEKFRKLYRSLQDGLLIENGLAELYLLKDEIKKEIEKISHESINQNKPISLPMVIKNSQFHFGSGDNVDGEKGQALELNWLSKYWWYFIIPIVSGIILFIINEGRLPKIIQNIPIVPSSEEARTLDKSIFELVAETDYMGPILSIEKRWQGFAGLKTRDEYATVSNYGDAGSGKTWVDFRGTNSYGGGLNVITCVFGNEWRQKIELFGKNDKEIIFKGTIRGDLTQGRVLILENCSLKSLSTSTPTSNL